MTELLVIIFLACFVYKVNEFLSTKTSFTNRKNLPKQKAASTTKQVTFAPKVFSDYIGQHKAKDLLTSYISGTIANEATVPHVIIYGPPGTGKTTLARVFTREISNTVKKPTKKCEVIAKALKDVESFVNVVKQLDGGYFIIDEVHACDRDFVEQLYTIMTDFVWNGEQLQPFTLIGCTTEFGEMFEKYEPFVQRFKIRIKLDDYSEDDLEKILTQYAANTYKKSLSNLDECIKVIAKNARKTPRNALSYLDAAYYLGGDVNKALYNYSIIKDGYTTDDKKILEYLNTVDKAGVKAMCAFVGTSEKNYLQQEGHLFRNGLISRTARGRALTDKGCSLLEELKNA